MRVHVVLHCFQAVVLDQLSPCSTTLTPTQGPTHLDVVVRQVAAPGHAPARPVANADLQQGRKEAEAALDWWPGCNAKMCSARLC